VREDHDMIVVKKRMLGRGRRGRKKEGTVKRQEKLE
jgi:hypothetical protein